MFLFDRVFGADKGQDTVFEEITQLVQSALDGYKVGAAFWVMVVGAELVEVQYGAWGKGLGGWRLTLGWCQEARKLRLGFGGPLPHGGE